ncbi:MAG TPA: hypothetical protein VJ396_10135 [Acidiferrobacterales bacterium]|nr:hypothetical protein [Acidiferrobacterales bacterium]
MDYWEEITREDGMTIDFTRRVYLFGYMTIVIASLTACASSTVKGTAEGREVIVTVPLKTNYALTRDEAIKRVRQEISYDDLDPEVKSIINRNFSQTPEKFEKYIPLTGDEQHRTIENLELSLRSWARNYRFYTYKNSWSHADIQPQYTENATVTWSDHTQAGKATGTVLISYRLIWDWRNRKENLSRECPTCYAESYVRLHLDTQAEVLHDPVGNRDTLQIRLKLKDVQSKSANVLGKAVADTSFDLDLFLQNLPELASSYQVQRAVPVTPYSKANIQSIIEEINDVKIKRQIAAKKMTDERNSRKAAERQKALNEWRNRIKIGENVWVGPLQNVESFSGSMMVHAMVLERRGNIVQVQFDGGTDRGFVVNMPEKTQWFKLNSLYPDNEYTMVGTGRAVFTPSSMPTIP